MAYNSTYHPTLGCTPFELTFRRSKYDFNNMVNTTELLLKANRRKEKNSEKGLEKKN